MNPGRQWIEAMRAQDLERAWRISDRVLRDRRCSAKAKHSGPRHLQQIWHGEPLGGRHVLVRCYHGLGDTIQFIRFVKPLRRSASRVTVWCQPELQGLMRRIAEIDRVLPLHDGVVESDFDVDIEVMELPHALRVTAAAVAADVPYLHVAAQPVATARDALHVGLVWQAGAWDSRRSISRHDLEPLTAVGGVRLYALQPGAAVRDAAIADWSSPSIETLACRLRALDLVITVDTMAAHLAGALGVRTWTLLHGDADWRWGLGGSCVWYPTMRLFRQSTAGDWTMPIRAMAGTLRRMVRART